MRPDDTSTLATRVLTDWPVQVGTLCHAVPAAEAGNSNTVKVGLATNEDALYFSNLPIPHPRDGAEIRSLKHVGVYACGREVLEMYESLPQPMNKQAEKLE